MGQLIVDIGMIVMGLYFLLNYKKLAQRAAEWQYKTFKIRESVTSYEMGYFVGGLFAVFVGILSLIGVLPHK